MAAQVHYDSYAPDRDVVRASHFSKALLILLASTLPALILLYVTTRFHIRILFLAALWLNLLLIGSAGIVVVISGILGALEERKYNRLAHPNTHPKPRGFR